MRRLMRALSGPWGRPDRAARQRRSTRPGFEHLETRELLSAAFSVVNDWGSGFQGQFVVKNDAQPTTMNQWTLGFNFPYALNSIWNAQIVSHQGSQYVVQGLGWDQAPAPGASLTVGFTGTPGNVTSAPTGVSLSDAPSAHGSVSAAATYQVTGSWNTGYTANIVARPTPAAAPVNNWVLEFDSPTAIVNIWGASITSHVGQHFVLNNAGWNSQITPGATVTIGFQGLGSGLPRPRDTC